MSCLPQPGDVVVCDELVHNSVRMGCRLGRQKETVLFRHNDFQHLETTLEGLRSRGPGSAPANIFVAVESVYSMDGDLAPLREILGVAAAHGALVIVDEAHGTGVFGEQGRGLVSALNLEAHPALLAGMHSFGKAFGAHGAVVVGSATLKDFLVNYARPLIYSTSLPLDSLACIRCAYLMQASADDRRKRVLDLADAFQSLLSDADVNRWAGGTAPPPPLDAKDIPRHRSPIQSVLIAGNERCLLVADSLRALGFDVRAIRKPTVAEGTERLRITLHAYNTDEEVESLARHIRRLTANKGNSADKARARTSEEDEGGTRASGGGLARDSILLLGESATRARL
ncbi:putative 8-amino-7-oxononanoate synthase [Ectocarpus siliculosus]|uniref:8-amino-7-oxononanoate synthase n=1 Tax=Ectocarpus siliculosus TaxID=2880 RepID=D8LFH2_ECTSI|nr:putative 8-amino-7-oxononanoate synthase [Ectocarpus siliculosus]|eukprot:CBN79892.1 putative 8-amino-7-oxononanoate synthase [Ectocarpus siliculosus]